MCIKWSSDDGYRKDKTESVEVNFPSLTSTYSRNDGIQHNHIRKPSERIYIQIK